MRKSAEQQCVNTFSAHHIYIHKFEDVMRCPHCGQPIFKRSANLPDYLVTPSPIYVEVKQDRATGKWEFAQNIRDVQRETLEKNSGWLYLVLGTGRAPNGKSAWLFPWEVWVDIEKMLLERKQKSLAKESTKRSIGADDIAELAIWKLSWNHGKWEIPPNSPFWLVVRENKFQEILQ